MKLCFDYCYYYTNIFNRAEYLPDILETYNFVDAFEIQKH